VLGKSDSIIRRSRLLTVAALTAAMVASALSAQAASNLQGVWRIANPTVSLQPLQGEIPFTAAGKALYDANRAARAKGDFTYDLTQVRCSSPGPSRMMLTPDRFRIFQLPTLITLQFEWNRLYRHVDMRGGNVEDPLIGPMMGLSTGRWSGDDLVITTQYVSDRTLLDALIPHSDALKLTERLRLVDADTLEDRLTVEDPQTFTRPWEASITYRREAEGAFREDVCLDRLEAGQRPLPVQ
jgi:hypothetical protein